MNERRPDPKRRGRAESSSKRHERGRQRSDRPRGEAARRDRSDRPSVHLSRDIVEELHATARPGKGSVLVKVFGEAAGAFAAGDYETAARLGEQAKHMALRAASVRELLGLAHYRLSQWKEAARELSSFRRLAGTTEQNPVIADCYRAMHKPERALELCDEIDGRSADPALFFEARIVASGALADLGRLDDAIGTLEGLPLDPEVAEEHHLRAWYALGDLLARRGRFTQARAMFEAVVNADPELTDAAERVSKLNAGRGPPS
jgi:tetratricopeptide (TPR) repeat protein